MIQKNFTGCLLASLLLTATMGPSALLAEEGARQRSQLREPLLRIARATQPNPNAHPLDPALELARYGLKKIQSDIRDYTCTLVKRERINGELLDYEYIFLKVRNRRVAGGKIVTPFSVYMYFLKPEAMKGREVLYIEGQNNGKMIAHEGGSAGKYLPTVWLKPDSFIAMRNQKYPLTDIGLENLVAKLIERGELDKKAGRRECTVTFHENAKINGRPCTLLQIKNPKPTPNLDFFYAQIFIDNELEVPIRYAAYGFPEKPGERPPVIEEYTYLNLKINVGLADKDFDHNNPDYGFH